MTLVVQSQVPVIIGITVFLIILVLIANRKIRKYDVYSKPTVFIMLLITFVELIDNLVNDVVSYKYVEKMGPYIGSIAAYILCSNYVGLLGLDNPTMSYSVTLALALVTWVLIQKTDLKYSGIKGYVHSFFEPFFPFVIPNIFGCIAPLVSMSMRLFGNIISGSVLLQLVYSFTQLLSETITGGLIEFNFLGPIIAPALHAYFDLFSGLIQMFIFIMLTMALVGNKIPEEDKIKSIEGGK